MHYQGRLLQLPTAEKAVANKAVPQEIPQISATDPRRDAESFRVRAALAGASGW